MATPPRRRRARCSRSTSCCATPAPRPARHEPGGADRSCGGETSAAPDSEISRRTISTFPPTVVPALSFRPDLEAAPCSPSRAT
jgi:hypothetical protein